MFDKRWKDPKWYSYLAWLFKWYCFKGIRHTYGGAWIRAFDSTAKQYGEWLGQTLRIPVTVQVLTDTNSAVRCPRCEDPFASELVVRPVGICLRCFEKEHDRNETLWKVSGLSDPNFWTTVLEIIRNPQAAWQDYAQ